MPRIKPRGEPGVKPECYLRAMPLWIHQLSYEYKSLAAKGQKSTWMGNHLVTLDYADTGSDIDAS